MGLAIVKGARQQKGKILEELTDLFRRYNVVVVFQLKGTRGSIIHQLRRKMRGRAIIKVTKKNLARLAAERAGRSRLTDYIRESREPMGFIYSEGDPFRLKLELDKNRITTFAKAGEKADIDVTIPVMNTGLQPGPILSEFGKMKIPTKIEGGQIWIARETVVAKKGDVISPALASILSKLNIPSVVKGLEVLGAFYGDLLIPAEKLTIDPEATLREMVEAHSSALSFAVNVNYYVPESIVPIMARAYREAISVGVEAGVYEPDVIYRLLAIAESQVKTLSEMIKS
ncbi:MAG: 50S ribosomal protein L10 [Aigarchaeota archaeon]|nr:50S ribosomal protein L10 [Aigarchaeota archaeon]MDW8092684.1 50S ribosomal protein L10 [Nitrososphaerota archaeon]